MSSNDEISRVQEERGKSYGSFVEHTKAVEKILRVLREHRKANNKDNIPEGFETTLFYIVSKLVRMNNDPLHRDSCLDLESYARLWRDNKIDDNSFTVA